MVCYLNLKFFTCLLFSSYNSYYYKIWNTDFVLEPKINNCFRKVKIFKSNNVRYFIKFVLKHNSQVVFFVDAVKLCQNMTICY